MRVGDLILDRFEVVHLTGSGGIGHVYRGIDRLNGSPVAIKALRLASSRDVERFLREAKVLSRLRHPAIVRYIAHGSTEQGEPVIVMEWLDGEDLATRLSRQPLSPLESANVVRRAAEALAVAHRHGVVHRDIKPSNLFLRFGALDDLKLLDFGLAWMDDATHELTREGLVVGTLGYMAPEQAAGDRQIDARTDVFALGCVLYRCLTGRPPFDSDRVGAMLMKILHEEPLPIAAPSDDIPSELQGLVGRMLSKDPAPRPKDGAAVAEELALIIERLPVDSDGPPTSRPAITHTERQFACFVAVGKPSDWLLPDSSRLVVLFDIGPDRVALAREIAARRGGQLSTLADGSLVVALTSSAPATDLASHAARCALELRQLLPSAPIVVTTGRNDQGSGPFVGKAIEAIAEMLATSSAFRSEPEMPIRLDVTTAGLLDAGFEVRGDDVGLMLVGERRLTEQPRLLLGKPTPCVGRERELLALSQIMEEITTENVARFALVTGPPGSGKSRIRRELQHIARKRRDKAQVWITAGQVGAFGAPFALLSGFVQSAAHVCPEDAPTIRIQKLLARIKRHIEPVQSERVAAFVGESAGIAFPEEGELSGMLRAARSDPALMAEQIRRAWLDFLSAELCVGPLVLILEDLHWGDPPSIALLSGIVRRLHDRPLLALGFARPEVHDTFPRLGRDLAIAEIRLRELSRRASEELLRIVVGDSMRQAQINAIVERSGGNPFYLEELLRAAYSGLWGSLPDSVLAMVQARLAGLSAGARRVLRAASIFGPRFHLAGVRTLLGDTESSETFSHWIDMLTEAELIEHPSGAWDGGAEMVFRHMLVCEAVYETLSEQDKRLGHTLAGTWLADSDEPSASVIARHFGLGGETSRAAEYHLLAAEAALGVTDLHKAIVEAEQGIACGVSGELYGGLQAVLLRAFMLKGDPDKAEPYAKDPLSLLPKGCARWCGAVAAAAMQAMFRRNWKVLAEIGEMALDVEPEEAALDAYGGTLATIAIVFFQVGMVERAAKLVTTMASVALRAPDERLSTGWLDLVHAFHSVIAEGDPWSQREHALAAVAAFAWARDLTNWGIALLQVAAALRAMGGSTEALSKLEEALSKLSPVGECTVSATAHGQLAVVLAELGRPQEAILQARSALSIALGAHNSYAEIVSRRALVQVLVLTDLLAEAEKEAQELESLLPSTLGSCGSAVADVETLPQLEAAVALAQVRFARGCNAEALSMVQAAMHWLDAHGGAGSIEASLRLLHVEVLRKAGQPQAAQAALARAKARIYERAAKITEPRWRASFLENVPENARTLMMV